VEPHDEVHHVLKLEVWQDTQADQTYQRPDWRLRWSDGDGSAPHFRNHRPEAPRRGNLVQLNNP
jgi:hypothetical protein